MNPAYPAGMTQREHDEVFAGAADSRLSAVICPSCKREIEERYPEIWYVDDRRIPDGPIASPDGEQCCSQKCLSQHIYNSLSDDDREAMRDLAIICHEYYERIGHNFDAWCMKHSALRALLNPLSLRLLDSMMREQHAALGGIDSEPAWFEQAIEMGARHGAQGEPATTWGPEHPPAITAETPRALPFAVTYTGSEVRL